MSIADDLARVEALLDRMIPDNGLGKVERTAWWRTCADGWKIAYTTTRAVGGRHDGKFVVLAYKPIGKGAKGGKETAQEWSLAYDRGFTQRKAARDRGITLWQQHEEKGMAR